MFSLFLSLFIYLFFISTVSKNLKCHPLHSLGHQEALFWSCSPDWRESLKRPYFPLLLSILAGTNLIMLFIFFCNPRLIPKKIHTPFDFRENSSSFDFRENPCKTPKQNQKPCFIFAPCVFWICSRGLFAFEPFDLNFTNPKSTIFEPGWKTQPLPANHDQITKQHRMFFFF